MHLKVNTGRQKSYLQWYPFSLFSREDRNKLMSRDYYDKYVENGKWLLNPNFLEVRDHYFPNMDGSFRNVILVSPFLFLVIQCFGYMIMENFDEIQSSRSDIYYAGDMKSGRIHYAAQYDKYIKSINYRSQGYEYVIKLDIKSFFDNVSIDILFSKIEAILKEQLEETDINLMKNMLLMIGKNKFPTIENSSALSYLASIVYLETPEQELIKKLDNLESITSFEIVRYVDDTVVLLNIENGCKINEIFVEIVAIYNTILFEYNLTLNGRKSLYNKTSKLGEILRQAFYDEEVNNEKFNLQTKLNITLLPFLRALNNDDFHIDYDNYENLITECFNAEELTLQPQEVLTALSLQDVRIGRAQIINELQKLVSDRSSVIRMDPKRLTRIIVNTKDGDLIRRFLNGLFKRSRDGKWSRFDMCCLIQYITLRNFKQDDLIKILGSQDANLHEYYIKYCKNTDWLSWDNEATKIMEIEDDILSYLYGMHLIEFEHAG